MKVTADTIVSDGTVSVVIFSIEGINDEGRAFVNSHKLSSPLSDISFDEKGSEQIMGSSYGIFIEEDYQEENISYVAAEFELEEEKITEPANMILDMGLGSDITLSIDFASNINYKTFANKDGEEITLTPLNLSCRKLISEVQNGIDIFLTMSDGTVHEADFHCAGSCSPDDVNYVSYVVFGELIDIDNLESVEWCGEIFTKLS